MTQAAKTKQNTLS